MKVYIVTAGTYSDYHIETVFSSKESACAFTEAFNRTRSYDRANVEEYETDVIEVKTGYNAYSVLFDEDGQVTRVERDPYASEFNKYSDGRVCLMAKDIDHALKIARDIKAQSEAEKIGL